MSGNVDEAEISKVLFELASNRRASILFELKKNHLKMQQLADSLDMTVTETFRHLQRLSEANLVEKKANGAYSITSVGNLAIGFLEGFNFVLKNETYFLERDLSCIPYTLVDRLGEIKSSEFCGGVLASLNAIRRLVFDAKDYVLAISDQVDSSHIEVTNKKVSQGLKFKFLMEKGYAKEVLINPDVEHLKERRFLERIPACTIINEKGAFLAFRSNNGVLDYSGFFSEDEKFRQWCKDLFEYYWKKLNVGIRVSK